MSVAWWRGSVGTRAIYQYHVNGTDTVGSVTGLTLFETVYVTKFTPFELMFGRKAFLPIEATMQNESYFIFVY